MRILFILITAFLLLGCQHGPATDALKKEIQTKLDSRFQNGLFVVKDIYRSGSYPYTEKDSSVPHLLVYFRARIEFASNYSMADWNKLNLASLSSLLGSAPMGIKGIEKSGNKKGDILEVYGTSSYRQEDGKWVPTSRALNQEGAQKAAPVLDDQTDSDKQIEYLKKQITALKKKHKEKHLEVLDEELNQASMRVHLRLNSLDNITTLISGLPSGEYAAIGKGAVKSAEKQGFNLSTYETKGSIENCQLIEQGLADFAISQNDISLLAFKGVRPFHKSKPMQNLRAVCSLYPEAVQIIVKQSSSIHSFSDLKGKTINIGQEGSGSRINAQQLLEHFNIKTGDYKQQSLNPKESVSALQSDKVDAIFLTMAWPIPFINDDRADSFRLLPISSKEIVELQKKYPFFVPVKIPANTYSWLNQTLETAGVTATLITHKDTPDNEVTSMMKTLFSGFEFLSEESNQASYISSDTAKMGISIPIHPAASRFLSGE
jgi:TRAP transporter TAXI family solute receptor